MDDRSAILDRLEEFSAALVFVEKDDPGSFQDGLKILDELLEHPAVKKNPAIFERLAGLRKSLEECVFESEFFSEQMEEMEKELKEIRAAFVDDEEPVSEVGEAAEVEDSEPEGAEPITAEEADTEIAVTSQTASPEPVVEGCLGLGMGSDEDRELVDCEALLEVVERAVRISGHHHEDDVGVRAGVVEAPSVVRAVHEAVVASARAAVHTDNVRQKDVVGQRSADGD